MGTVDDPKPVKLVCGLLAARGELFEAAIEALCERLGEIDFSSPELPFDSTDYYADEMGAGIRRRFVAFERLIDPGDLADIKLATNALETEFGRQTDGELRRTVNFDPGYLHLAKLVLATTKDFAHRVYLGKGLYAEVTLRFREGGFEPFDWTYPDYRTAECHAFLREVRRRYREQLREGEQ